MAVFDMLETALVKKLHFSPSFMLRFVTRTVYVGKCSFQATLFSLSATYSERLCKLVPAALGAQSLL
jgi:hypothetical protein